jgi:hypothetical protein
MKSLAGRAASPLVRLFERRVIHGYRGFLGKGHGRALLSYLVVPLLFPFRRVGLRQFSNRGMARELPRALNELGLTVDIVDFRNQTWVPNRRYDLFIGHGGFNFAGLRRAVGPSVPSVCFATGIYWRDFNSNVTLRSHELAVRRGYFLPPERFCDSSEEEACRAADLIACLGNAAAAHTYARFGAVRALDNAAYPVEWEVLRGKDHAGSRRHFLFFSGPGNLHKGLDRLVESFAASGLHLHVCQDIEPRFGQLFRHELLQTNTIQSYGVISTRSRQFMELVRKCAWVILPTCAEGQPGSVIECMAHGLIPILPAAANMDLDGFGLLLPDCEPETISKVTERAANMTVQEVQARSEGSQRAAATRYSVERFRENFKAAVVTTLNGRE